MANQYFKDYANTRTEDTSPDIDNDVVVTYDNSATTTKKVKLKNLVGSVLLALRTAFSPASSSGPASLTFHEDTDNGTNKVVITAPDALAGNRTATLQDATGTIALTDGIGLPCEWVIACSDETTSLSTGTAKVTFRAPHAMTLNAGNAGVRASVNTAPTGSTIIVDVNEAGTTILSTKLSIDASEKTSLSAASAAVVSDTAIADDAEITIDFDQVGSTIPGKGLKVVLRGVRV